MMFKDAVQQVLSRCALRSQHQDFKMAAGALQEHFEKRWSEFSVPQQAFAGAGQHFLFVVADLRGRFICTGLSGPIA